MQSKIFLISSGMLIITLLI